MTRENWQTALADVEEGVRACLAALDRYEAAFDGILTPTTPAVPPDRTPDDWNAALARATDETNRMEHLLAEQAAAWDRWHAALGRWEESLQQPR
jgi:hypothetical protein